MGIERIYGALALVFCLLAKRFVSNSDVNILFAVAEKTFLTCCMPQPPPERKRERSAGYLRLPRRQLAAGHQQVLQVKPSAVQAHTSERTMAIKHKYFTGGGTDKRP